MTSAARAMGRELASLVGKERVLTGRAVAGYVDDATSVRGISGSADAVVLPASADHVVSVTAWCAENSVALTPRGGGTGYSGGCVPDGGVVVAMQHLSGRPAVDALEWRMRVRAGTTTAEVHRAARENGLYFPPDPGAAEQSQIGGNVATNAGGPHAFKYGVVGHWVTGVEVVVPPGELIQCGGPTRKDVAGYDLKALLVGSEGTLGVITSCWLRLIPPPQASLPVIAFFPSVAAGCDAIDAARASGIVPAAIEYLDGRATEFARATYPSSGPDGANFTVIAEADGTEEEAVAGRAELLEALGPGSTAIEAPETQAEIRALWRWRDGLGLAADAQHGGKISEDIAVPVDRLREAIEETSLIGERHALDTCSWGHAGDGNLHSTFLIDLARPEDVKRAEQAAQDLFALARRLGGNVSGEHGLGLVKNGQLGRQWSERALAIGLGIRNVFDPTGICNPGKKLP